MMISITLLLIHATKSCLSDNILDTLIDDEEYELFQGILGELDNLDLLDEVEHTQYEAEEVRESVTVPATQIEDTTTEDYIVEDSVYTEDEVVDNVVNEFSEEFVEIVKRGEAARGHFIYLVAGVVGAVLFSLVVAVAILYIAFTRHRRSNTQQHTLKV